jgi:hypothetical protein
LPVTGIPIRLPVFAPGHVPRVITVSLAISCASIVKLRSAKAARKAWPICR